MKDLLIALALAITIEGVIFALFPAGMKRYILSVLDTPESTLRIIGLIAAVAGVIVIAIVRSN